jgi:leader peptidase (prepilin peptidase) / N-methyltransferase
VSVLLPLAAAVLGLAAGVPIDRAAGGFPWRAGVFGRPAVRPPALELVTAALFALAAVRFGLSAELPAFLFLAGAGVLLAVIDLRHRLLPNRVVLPSLAIGFALLLLPAALHHEWSALLRAVVAAAVLFAVFLVLALVLPGGLGMGDVKLAALLGLYLGWLGWAAVLIGALAGFFVQAVLAVALLATRRIGLRGELPFGPAMLVGAALAVGWAEPLVHGYFGGRGAA